MVHDVFGVFVRFFRESVDRAKVLLVSLCLLAHADSRLASAASDGLTFGLKSRPRKGVLGMIRTKTLSSGPGGA